MEYTTRGKNGWLGENRGKTPVCETTMFARQRGPYDGATMLASTSLSSAWIYSGGLGPSGPIKTAGKTGLIITIQEMVEHICKKVIIIPHNIYSLRNVNLYNNVINRKGKKHNRFLKPLRII